MLSVLGWILFGLLLIWFVTYMRFSYKHMRFSHAKRLHLNYYTVYLLLDDEIRDHHKHNFQQWIRDSHAPDASSLSLAAYKTIENMADQLAIGDPTRATTSSILGASSMLWNYKKHQG
jgi:hypothetical protein